jgi:hypothetical protein
VECETYSPPGWLGRLVQHLGFPVCLSIEPRNGRTAQMMCAKRICHATSNHGRQSTKGIKLTHTLASCDPGTRTWVCTSNKSELAKVQPRRLLKKRKKNQKSASVDRSGIFHLVPTHPHDPRRREPDFSRGRSAKVVPTEGDHPDPRFGPQGTSLL